MLFTSCDLALNNSDSSSFTPTDDNASSCQGQNCSAGSGAQSVQIFVEPAAGVHVITDAIASAKKSVMLEIYLLTARDVINALEEAAHRGVDVRVMLELHPYGGGTTSPQKTLDLLLAAGVKAKATSSDFSLTHEKGMVIDNTTVYIMTCNLTASALGLSSSTKNREYGIIDTHQEDVQAVISIFAADWNRTTPQFHIANLVVSPINSRVIFTTLLQNARQTILVEAEEMQDNGIEQALIAAYKRGVKVQVIVPPPSSASDRNSAGIKFIQKLGVQVREDTHLYMHAKIIVVDGQKAFVGSENISTASLNRNRELGIVVSDTQVLATLQQTFQQDWNDSQVA